MIRSFVLSAVLLVTPAAHAQQPARTLHWQRLDVQAHLDADGRLHVRERQAIVFDGAWNGGERTFRIRPGQQLHFNGITRLDPAGTAHPLLRGDLDRVDDYDFTSSSTLRWRSRLPSDAPFANQLLVYELDYVLSGILIEGRDAYTLDHDFAFPDRAGVIEQFSLQLDADPAWHSTALPVHMTRANILPGASVVVTVPLHYTIAGAPASVQHPASPAARIVLLLALLAAVVFVVLGFYREESRRGRFAPLKPVREIDEAWLREHVFSVPPEVVGAAWDKTTGAPEVAAFIARMVQEGKLTSRVEERKRKHILHLALNVPRPQLSEQELKLIDALFDAGSVETDTEAIRQRYKKSGFDPASIIRAGIQQKVKALVPQRRSADPMGVLIMVLLVLSAIATLAIAIASMKSGPVVLVPIAIGVGGLFAIIPAGIYRNSVAHLSAKIFAVLIPLLIVVLPAAALLLDMFVAAPAPIMADVVLLAFSLTALVTRIARTGEDDARLELRRSLAAARAYFEHQLAQKQPALEDAWFPYLLAFGLGKHIDKWFRAFGGTTHDVALVAASTVHGSSVGGWTGGGALFGGGGGFAGGGAGRSWTSAVQTFSSGVPSPSSGGGGGGGGSSGGGGGGGW